MNLARALLLSNVFTDQHHSIDRYALVPQRHLQCMILCCAG